jgi:hypothetical protein
MLLCPGRELGLVLVQGETNDLQPMLSLNLLFFLTRRHSQRRARITATHSQIIEGLIGFDCQHWLDFVDFVVRGNEKLLKFLPLTVSNQTRTQQTDRRTERPTNSQTNRQRTLTTTKQLTPYRSS